MGHEQLCLTLPIEASPQQSSDGSGEVCVQQPRQKPREGMPSVRGLTGEERKKMLRDYKRWWRQQHPYTAEQKKRMKNWRRSKKEKWDAIMRRHRAKNKDKINERRRLYYQKNKERIKEQSRICTKRWANKNRDHIRVKGKEWKIKNPDARASYSAKRRERKRSEAPGYNKKYVQSFYAISRRISRCLGIKHHVDHIVALANGGAHHQDNLQILTWRKNLSKGVKLTAV